MEGLYSEAAEGADPGAASQHPVAAPGAFAAPAAPGAFASSTGLEYELGKELGLRFGGEVSISVVQSAVRGADQGNRGNI